MELRHVRYFLAVAEELNFTRGAAKVGIGQSPLSQQIRALEQELGAALFRRLPHGAELTEAGRAFLPEAQATLAQAERAMSAARRGARGESGRLKIGYTSSAAFNPIVPATLRAFRMRYPAVDLSLEEDSTTGLLDRLQGEALDVALIRPGATDPEGLRIFPIDQEPMVAVLPIGHPLAEADRLPLSALAAEAFVLFPRAAGPSLFDEVIAACRRAGFEPVLGQVAPEIASVGNLVAAGFGVSIVPASIAQVRVTGVVYIPIRDDARVFRLVLAIRRDNRSVTVRNFTSLLAAERLGAGGDA
jgi:DNA-binding transcriptional LysR family regulator